MEQDIYKTPILNSRSAVTLVKHEGLITPEHRCATISLDANHLPIRPEDIESDPLAVKSVIVVTRRTGDPTPTPTEIEFCAAWKKALDGTGVQLVDYIIMSGGAYYSFADERTRGRKPKGI